MPTFFRGGNLELARAGGRKVLLMGAEEMAMNQKWFVEAFGFEPGHNAVPEILKRATGADEVLILPNSRNLYYLDMFVTPLADGTVGLLAPVDAQRLAAADRDVLSRKCAAQGGRLPYRRAAEQRRADRQIPIPRQQRQLRQTR
jgi:hypothetical protein